jgi:hypothetical protein
MPDTAEQVEPRVQQRVDAADSREAKVALDPSSLEEVDTGDTAALHRWAVALGLTPEALEGAIRIVGPRVDRIKDYLTGGMAGHQEDA